MSLLSLLFGKKEHSNKAINLLNSPQFKSKVEGNDVQLVDVRTAKEFNSEHIEGAKNIDFFSGNFTAAFNQLNKDKAVFLYCRSGGRSRQASKRLLKLGFQEIYDLKGGFLKYHSNNR